MRCRRFQRGTSWWWRVRVISRVGLAALVQASFAGCATYNNALDAVGYLSPSAVVIKVPFERQPSETLCGLAAADMVSRYYHRALAPGVRSNLQREAATLGGISGGNLRDAFAQSGYRAFVFSADLHNDATGILWNLDRGRPLIVMYIFKHTRIGHYVVLAGYDPKRHSMVVFDPRFGQRVVSRREFLRAWEASGRFTLLAQPRE